MKLDKRITIISDIYSVNDGCHDWKFMNQTGYFANHIEDFSDLSKCTYGKYTDYREQDTCFSCRSLASNGVTPEYDWFTYFIPEYDLKPEEPEKKYRPFTFDEFTKEFSLGDEIIVKRKDDGKIRHRLFIEYTEDEKEDIRLGSFFFSFEELFNKYELYTGEGWKPFGIEE